MKKELMNILKNSENNQEDIIFVPKHKYKDRSIQFFSEKKSPTSIYKKIHKQKNSFSAFFNKFDIKVYEILEIEKQMTLGVIGIIDKIQSYSRESIRANNLTNLIGVNKFSKNDEEAGCDQNDFKIFLNDNTGRIELIIDEKKVQWITTQSILKYRKFSKNLLINGVIIGIIGETKDFQNLIVDTVIFEGIQSMPKNFKKQKIMKENHEKNFIFNNYFSDKEVFSQASFILFISNLEFNSYRSLKGVRLCQEFTANSIFSNKIQKIIIIGNVLDQFENFQAALQSSTKTKDLYEKFYQEVQEAFKNFDNFIQKLVHDINHITIDIMPGSNDSQSSFLPQKSLENYIKKSVFHSFINFVSNPFLFSYNGYTFLGTSGQNIKELKNYSDYHNDDTLDIMEKICYWGNICPKNPNGREFDERFELKKTGHEFPNLFFSGNTKEFKSRNIYEEESGSFCKMITIPNFSLNPSGVLVNVLNLDCFEVKFL